MCEEFDRYINYNMSISLVVEPVILDNNYYNNSTLFVFVLRHNISIRYLLSILVDNRH